MPFVLGVQITMWPTAYSRKVPGSVNPAASNFWGHSESAEKNSSNGAPFDLFFSADSEYPKKLEDVGLAEPGTLREYAVGHIVIWTPRDSEIDAAKAGWQSLLDQRVKKIAIANPDHAPYGRAALAALKKAGIYEQVKGKLVYGENISQAAEFVQSGNAQAGIVALSLALSPAMKDGSSWEVPAKLYPSIFQSVVVMKASKNKDAALKFLQFVKSEAGQEILLRFGFTIPIQASDILSLRLDDARRTLTTLSYQR